MFLFPLLLAFYTVAKAEVAFEKVSPILTARRGSVGGILFNEEHSVDEIWVVGGSNSGVSNQDVGKNVEVYTPSINQWRTEPPMEFSRCDHGAATIQKQTLYVAGGMTSCKDIKAQNICNTSDAAMFSTTTKTWTTLPSMNQARRGLSLAADEKNGIIYAVGGMNCMSNCYSTPVEYLTTLEAFEVALGTWTVLPSMHVGRRDLATALHGDILFAFGGCGGDGTVLDYAHCQALSTVEMYNPSTRQWTILNDMASPRHGFALGIFYFPMQGSGSGVSHYVVAGGTMADGIDATHAKQNLSTTVDAYSAATDSWRTIALLPDPRDGLMKGYGLVVENKFYLVSGSTVEEDYVNTTEAVSFSTDLMF